MLTDKQNAALKALQSGPKVLHVAIGGALVKAGYATKDTTTGHGKLMASYRLVQA
jgi:hypothetical protein